MAGFRIVLALLAMAGASAFTATSRWTASPTMSMATEKGGMRKKEWVRALNRCTKDTFNEVAYGAKSEAFVSAAGSSMGPKLKSKIKQRARELGVEARADFCREPWSGPPLWLKAQAAEDLKKVVASRDVEAINAKLEEIEGMEDVEFKVPEGAEDHPLIADAKAVIAEVEAEAEAAGAEEAAPAEEAAEEASE
eukprot:CAMPEP_0205905590 /NCGR_PEP_ID=MMETSP1325-20131115/1441_1 /ASSEMBLY_ACC=CAM_ASM_000708 /TAXON_ID=236786 /ORGANISM="Florenciella sp., Strain RCC1007" /LENGTH=193 /DNA_ID=CAMNT_0053271509 /DNA_START=29 /DNA_END=610 /DNA_ORIENTATION=+